MARPGSAAGRAVLVVIVGMIVRVAALVGLTLGMGVRMGMGVAIGVGVHVRVAVAGPLGAILVLVGVPVVLLIHGRPVAVAVR
jgi:hypothetical protein